MALSGGAAVRSAVSRGEARRLDLRGRTAVVTGAGNGIGRQVALELARRGATVAILDADPDAARAVGREVDASELAQTVDVRDRGALTAAVRAVVAAAGRLDVVVANAGVAPSPATLRTVDPDEFDRVVAINQTGVFNTVHPAIEPVIAQRGHIVVVASVAAFVPGVGGAPYMVSKSGAEALGRALRVELAPHGATAGVAYFGVVDTAMTRETLDQDPIGRAAEALLPAPLRRRISPAVAARVLVDGIERRAPSTMAPGAWRAWALGRGLADAVADRTIAADPRTQRLVLDLERRARGDAR